MEAKYTQTLMQEMVYLKCVTVLIKHKVNGKEQNSQQRGWAKVSIIYLKLLCTN